MLNMESNVLAQAPEAPSEMMDRLGPQKALLARRQQSLKNITDLRAMMDDLPDEEKGVLESSLKLEVERLENLKQLSENFINERREVSEQRPEQQTDREDAPEFDMYKNAEEKSSDSETVSSQESSILEKVVSRESLQAKLVRRKSFTDRKQKIMANIAEIRELMLDMTEDEKSVLQGSLAMELHSLEQLQILFDESERSADATKDDVTNEPTNGVDTPKMHAVDTTLAEHASLPPKSSSPKKVSKRVSFGSDENSTGTQDSPRSAESTSGSVKDSGTETIPSLGNRKAFMVKRQASLTNIEDLREMMEDMDDEGKKVLAKSLRLEVAALKKTEAAMKRYDEAMIRARESQEAKQHPDCEDVPASQDKVDTDAPQLDAAVQRKHNEAAAKQETNIQPIASQESLQNKLAFRKAFSERRRQSLTNIEDLREMMEDMDGEEKEVLERSLRLELDTLRKTEAAFQDHEKSIIESETKQLVVQGAFNIKDELDNGSPPESATVKHTHHGAMEKQESDGQSIGSQESLEKKIALRKAFSDCRRQSLSNIEDLRELMEDMDDDEKKVLEKSLTYELETLKQAEERLKEDTCMEC